MTYFKGISFVHFRLKSWYNWVSGSYHEYFDYLTIRSTRFNMNDLLCKREIVGDDLFYLLVFARVYFRVVYSASVVTIR